MGVARPRRRAGADARPRPRGGSAPPADAAPTRPGRPGRPDGHRGGPAAGAWSPSWCASGGPRSTSPPSRASSPRSRPWNPRPRGTRDRHPAAERTAAAHRRRRRALPRRPRHGRRGRRRDAGVPRAGVREHPRGRSRAVRGRPRARQDARRAEPRCRLRPRLPPAPVHARPAARRHHRVVRLRPGDHRVRLPTGAGVHRDVPRRRDQPHVTEDPVGAPRGDGRGPGHGRGRGLPAPPAVPRRRDVEPDRVRGHLRPAGGPTRPLHGAALGRVPLARGRAAGAPQPDRATPGGRDGPGGGRRGRHAAHAGDGRERARRRGHRALLRRPRGRDTDPPRRAGRVVAARGAGAHARRPCAGGHGRARLRHTGGRQDRRGRGARAPDLVDAAGVGERGGPGGDRAGHRRAGGGAAGGRGGGRPRRYRRVGAAGLEAR